MFLRHFLYSSLVNLPLLASSEERFTYKVLDCFLKVEDRDDFKKVLTDEATRNRFTLFWEAIAEQDVEAFSCF